MKQLTIELPNEFINSVGYKEAMSEYLSLINAKHLHPIYLCYNSTTKRFFVSKIFKNPEMFNVKIIQ